VDCDLLLCMTSVAIMLLSWADERGTSSAFCFRRCLLFAPRNRPSCTKTKILSPAASEREVPGDDLLRVLAQGNPRPPSGYIYVRILYILLRLVGHLLDSVIIALAKGNWEPIHIRPKHPSNNL